MAQEPASAPRPGFATFNHQEDVALLREAERGPLAFSVAKTALGPLTGAPCNLGNGEARVVSRELGLRWSPK